MTGSRRRRRTSRTSALRETRGVHRGRRAPASPKPVERPTDDIALPAIRGPLERPLDGEPADLLHLVVAVDGIATGGPHQEEVHGLPDPRVLPDVEVPSVTERFLDLGLDPRLLSDLSNRGVLEGLALLDAAPGQAPGELAATRPPGREADLD